MTKTAARLAVLGAAFLFAWRCGVNALAWRCGNAARPAARLPLYSQPSPSQQTDSTDEGTRTATDLVNDDQALFSPLEQNAVLALDEDDDNDDENITASQRKKDENESNPKSQTSVLTTMALIFAVASLSSLDRVTMSVALVPMSSEMGLTDTDKGSISSLFSVGYGLGILPAGLVLSQLSPRLVMASGIGLWSVGTLLTPLAATVAAQNHLDHDMSLLWTARAVVGASESVVVPTIQRLLSSWISPDRKSLAVATVFCGFQLGTILAYSLSPVVIDMAGGDWRNIFYVYGGVGLAFLVPWLLLAQDAPLPTAPVVTSTLDAKISSNVVQEETVSTIFFLESVKVLESAPWTKFARSKATWGMFLAHAANNWGLYNNLSWTPTFYSEQYGLNVKESTFLLILPSLTGAIGGLMAGSIADTMIQRIGSTGSEDAVTRVRKLFQFVALCGPAACLFLLSHGSMPDRPWMAVSLLSTALFLQAFNAAGYGAANQEKSGPKWTGLLYAVTSLPSVIVGTVGVYLTGLVLDATNQDWSIVFTINACVYVLGATAFVALYDSQREFD